MNVYSRVFGCKVNGSDASDFASALERLGVTQCASREDADAVAVFTCSVTAEAQRQCRQYLRSVRLSCPGAIVAVLGCGAQSVRDQEPSLADIFAPPGNAAQAARGIAAALSGKASRSPAAAVPAKRAKAYLKIQDGCVMGCAYCLISRLRGPLESMPPAQVAARIDGLVREGYSEIILVGIHLNSYRSDGKDILDLTESLEIGPGWRIRLGSLDPGIFLDPLTARRLSAVEGLCRHFHVPLQSGSDRVLEAMGRRYTGGEFLEGVASIRAAMPDAAVTSDVIVGFPGEDESDFADTVRVVRAAGLERAHIFPFSSLEGTPASGMPDQLTAAVKKRRARDLALAAGEVAKSRASLRAGTLEMTLLEKRSARGFWEGTGACGLKVRASGVFAGPGLAPVRITGCEDVTLTGAIECP